MEVKNLAKKEIFLEGLNCSSCADKIERRANKLPEIEKADLNFANQKLIVKVRNSEITEVMSSIKKIIHDVEPEVIVKEGLANEQQDNKSDIINDNLKQKGIKLGVGSLFFGIALLLNLDFWEELILYGLAYFIIGGKVLTKSVQNIMKGKVFDENFLMTVATLGAFAISKFSEAVAVMLFYEIGELFQDIAVNRSRRSIKSLLDIKPNYANLKENGKVKKVSPDQVQIGDTILIKPGEKIPLDGEVIEGESMLDTSALTGESVPRKIRRGEEVLSGSVNKEGLLKVKVRKEFEESAVNKILRLVESAASEKAPTEKFITKFARYYTPVVVISALGLAILPPLIIPGAVFSSWIYRALIFLVVSCPCALVISIPLGFFGGIGSASRKGVLVKGGNYLEALNELKTVVMDKTGTLTEGVFEVEEVVPTAGYSKEEVLELAAKAEVSSNHPIAVSILEAYGGSSLDTDKINSYQEIAGRGVKAVVEEEEILAGNHELMEENNIDYEIAAKEGTIVYIACEKEYIGRIVIADQIKVDAKQAISDLQEKKINNLVMLTGDNEQTARNVADKLGLNGYYAELLPNEKVSKVEELLEANKGKLAFVGDGINDAPVLARSDVGIAMGGLGSDAAIEAADVVLMKDNPSDLVAAIDTAEFTRKIVWQNIILALVVKGAVLLLGAFGMATMWEAVFADVGVALLAVLNAMRAVRY